MDDENWEDAFLEDLCRKPVEGTQDEEEDESSNEIVEATKIKTYKEVNEYLEGLQNFLESRRHATEALKIGSIINDVSCIQIKATGQTI